MESQETETKPECPICHEALPKEGEAGADALRCKHVFHNACLDLWLARSNTCPMCKAEARALPGGPVYLRDFGRVWGVLGLLGVAVRGPFRVLVSTGARVLPVHLVYDAATDLFSHCVSTWMMYSAAGELAHEIIGLGFGASPPAMVVRNLCAAGEVVLVAPCIVVCSLLAHVMSTGLLTTLYLYCAVRSMWHCVVAAGAWLRRRIYE